MIWKKIPGFKNYEVSAAGLVRSVARTMLYKKDGAFSTRKFKTKILKACPNKDGYLIVNLISKKGPESKYVHELVALAFLGPRPPGMQVLHGNDRKKDNRLSNLRYGTKLDNYLDAIKNGKTKSKIKLSEIEWVRKNKRLGVDRLSQLLKIPKSTIKAILMKETYKE